MKNVQHLPDSPMPPESLQGGRSPFSYMCIQVAEVIYRIVGLHPVS